MNPGVCALRVSIKTLVTDGWRTTGEGGRLKDSAIADLLADGAVVVVRTGLGTT